MGGFDVSEFDVSAVTAHYLGGVWGGKSSSSSCLP